MNRQARRKWTVESKLQVLKDAENLGITESLRKHNVSQALYHRWKREFNQQGVDGLQPKYNSISPEVKQLQLENERLKRIIARQALEMEFKDELLKKVIDTAGCKTCGEVL